jgi:hypothetical protein
LRRHCRRLPWREVVNAAAFEGDLSTHYLSVKSARYFIATLIAPRDALGRRLLPDLYEPVLAAIGNRVLVLRGFEQATEGQSVVQEWRCEMLERR